MTVYIKSLSENLIAIEKSDPTLEMRVSIISPAKEGSLRNRRAVLIRIRCRMRCGTEPEYFFLYTEQVRLEEGRGRTYVPSRTRFSTDCVLVASGKPFLYA